MKKAKTIRRIDEIEFFGCRYKKHIDYV